MSERQGPHPVATPASEPCAGGAPAGMLRILSKKVRPSGRRIAGIIGGIGDVKDTPDDDDGGDAGDNNPGAPG